MMKTLLAVSGDPGGARAILPVIQNLESKKEMDVVLLAYSAAVDVFEEVGYSVINGNDLSDPEQIKQLILEKQPQIVLTATSMHELALEQKVFRLCAQMSIPSLAVIDFWSNYGMRFELDGEIILPDCIAVMDETARGDMILEGFPAEKITVTGQPAFDRLAKKRREFSEEKKLNCLQNLGWPADSKSVLFFSQPIKKYFPDWEKSPGFQEHSVITDLLAAVNSIRPEFEKLFVGLVPHPTQSVETFQPYENEFVQVISPQRVSDELMMSADMVCGMTSSRLYEASLLGCKVLSLQTNSPTPWQFPGLAGDLIMTLTLRNYYPAAVKHLLVDELNCNNQQLFDESAAEKVSTELLRLLTEKTEFEARG